MIEVLVRDLTVLVAALAGASTEKQVDLLYDIISRAYRVVNHLSRELGVRRIYCTCCGRGDIRVVSCPNCGEPICQDCTPPFGAHVCEPE